MSELSLQKDVIDSVNQHGGHAFKASNRFLVGVVDIWAQMPGVRGCWLEAKKSAWPVAVPHVLLDLTIPQRRFLMAEHRAGGLAGVISFVISPGKLWCHIRKIDEFPDSCRLDFADHVRVPNRKVDLAAMVREFCARHTGI